MAIDEKTLVVRTRKRLKKTFGKKKSSTLAQRRAARKGYERAAAKTKPGEGARFKAVAKSARLGGAKSPKAVAASIMWKKYGKKGGAKLIAKGKKAAK